MKISFIRELKTMAAGGGAKFLNFLRNYFIDNNLYTDNYEEADVILFNSHHFSKKVVEAKSQYPGKIFVHRIDGPMRLYTKLRDKRDYLVNILNSLVADGTVFQSQWSKQENLRLGLKKNNFETVIINATDEGVFNREGKIAFDKNRKIRLIANSWSNNPKKGFAVYEWLDNNLDFDKYEMKFIGRSFLRFKNIHHLDFLSSSELAEELRKSDIYITGSENDPCSNSLIEALSCGLTVLAFNNGGHPEILGQAGELFTNADEIPGLLNKIIQDYPEYQRHIKTEKIKKTGEAYCDFCRKIYQAADSGSYMPKNISIFKKLIIKSTFNYSTLFNKLFLTDKLCYIGR